MYSVDFIARNGDNEGALYFNRENAMDYYNLRKGSGKLAGGAVVHNDQRIAEFGVMRDGVTVSQARKIMREG